MNETERLLSVARKGRVDRPPFICPGGMMTMIVTEIMDEIGVFWPEAHVDSSEMAELTLAAHRLAGVENLGVPFCMTVEAEAMGAKVTLGTKENEPRVIEYAIDRLADVDKIGEVRPGEGRAKVCVDAIRILKERSPDIPVIANLTGPLSLATSLVDPLLFYRAVRRDKAAAHELAAICTVAAMGFGDAMLEAGADVVCVADPSATGEIIGRPVFEEFALPLVNELAGHFRERYQAPSIVHICGDVRTLGKALADIDAEIISVDSVVSVGQLKELAGDKVSMGNVSTHLLERSGPAEVLEAGKGRLRAGVDILAPACGISPRTPIANIRSLYEAARDWRPESRETRGRKAEISG